MWVVFGGRLHKEFKMAVQEYIDIQIQSYEMVDEYKDIGVGVQGVIILDAGMYSIKEWGTVVNLVRELPGVPIKIYLRNEELKPDKEILGENVQVEYVGEGIYINNVVRDIRDIRGGK